MDTQRRIISIAGCALLLGSISATRFVVTGAHFRASVHPEPEACPPLPGAAAAKALEVSSVTGKRMVDADPKGCIWSNDPKGSDTSRRVALNLHSPRAFQFAMRPAITTIKVEPVSGIG